MPSTRRSIRTKRTFTPERAPRNDPDKQDQNEFLIALMNAPEAKQDTMVFKWIPSKREYDIDRNFCAKKAGKKFDLKEVKSLIEDIKKETRCFKINVKFDEHFRLFICLISTLSLAVSLTAYFLGLKKLAPAVFVSVCMFSCCLLYLSMKSWVNKIEQRAMDINRIVQELNSTTLHTRCFQLRTDACASYIEIQILEKPKSKFPMGVIGIEFAKFSGSVRSTGPTVSLRQKRPKPMIHTNSRLVRVNCFKAKSNASSSYGSGSSQLDLSNNDFDFLSVEDEELKAWEPSARGQI